MGRATQQHGTMPLPSADLQRWRPGISNRRPGARIAVPRSQDELMQRAVSGNEQREASGHDDQTPASRQRVGAKESNAKSCSSSLRDPGGRPATARSTPATTSARASTLVSASGSAPSSRTGTIAAMIVRADEDSADLLASGDSRGEYELTIHRASTSTTPPAMAALSQVRRGLFGGLREWDL